MGQHAHLRALRPDGTGWDHARCRPPTRSTAPPWDGELPNGVRQFEDGFDGELANGVGQFNNELDGAELLDDIEAFAGRFLAFPSRHHLVVIVLWVLHTWAVNAFYVTPRLVLDSPEPGSGKTRVLEVLALLCRAAKLTLSTTTAALYRRIAAAGDQPPTVLQDEADRVFTNKTPETEELVALFNSGYKAGATVDHRGWPGTELTAAYSAARRPWMVRPAL